MIALKSQEINEPGDAQKAPAENLKIIKEMPYISFNYLKENPSLDNCRQYEKNLKDFVKDHEAEVNSDKGLMIFISEVRKYLRPIIVADFALQSWQKGQQNAVYLTKTYGVYDTVHNGENMNTKKVNDCFTFVAKLQKHSVNLKPEYTPKMAYKMINSLPTAIDDDAREMEFVKVAQGGTLHLQVGDIMETKQGPFGSRSTHWGMLIEEDGKLFIVNRGTSKIFKMTIDEFLKNNRLGNIAIVRYGKPALSQHFEVDITKDFKGARSYGVNLVNRPLPEKSYYTLKEKESSLQKAEAGGSSSEFMNKI